MQIYREDKIRMSVGGVEVCFVGGGGGGWGFRRLNIVGGGGDVVEWKKENVYK